MWTCPQCETVNKDQHASCIICAAPKGEQKIYCWECGKQVKENAKFCRACGAETNTIEPEEAIPIKAQPKKTNHPVKEKKLRNNSEEQKKYREKAEKTVKEKETKEKKKRRKIAIICLACICVLAIGIGAVSLVKQNHDEFQGKWVLTDESTRSTDIPNQIEFFTNDTWNAKVGRTTFTEREGSYHTTGVAAYLYNDQHILTYRCWVYNEELYFRMAYDSGGSDTKVYEYRHASTFE